MSLIKSINNDVIRLLIYLTLMKVLVILPVYILKGSSFFLFLTTKWDSLRFEQIAEYGYSGSNYAFPPVYPYLIHYLTFLTGSYPLSAFLITNIISYIFPYNSI
ncbi:hypothetical protein [Acidianus manzaensis]|uniref:Glycosyltransferase RgtA/B/C/D-like domain-containing protein n=1 Tax=Acidianus manzaensis TaxID=282676 RepID=A0A1W6JWX5_9CREN|nr:hypothetical protein [Acidianus manzaensis]ARM74755.1 hypothetical protein B6F84_01090 [Acidianus manzaensis]